MDSTLERIGGVWVVLHPGCTRSSDSPVGDGGFSPE